MENCNLSWEHSRTSMAMFNSYVMPEGSSRFGRRVLPSCPVENIRVPDARKSLRPFWDGCSTKIKQKKVEVSTEHRYVYKHHMSHKMGLNQTSEHFWDRVIISPRVWFRSPKFGLHHPEYAKFEVADFLSCYASQEKGPSLATFQAQIMVEWFRIYPGIKWCVYIYI